MKQLTQSQEAALKIRLTDIIDLSKGINLLTRRMKKDDHNYLEPYLVCLEDDADSIKYIVNEIKIKFLTTK